MNSRGTNTRQQQRPRRNANSNNNGPRNPQGQQVYIPKVPSNLPDKQKAEKQKKGNSLAQSLRKENKQECKSAVEGRFVRYLPQDDAVAEGLGVEHGGLDPQETQAVADLLNNELSALLRLKPRQFWKAVAIDTSLHEFLDSYLQYKRRWFDLSYNHQNGVIAGVVVGDLDLNRRVFMILYRISSNNDPGSPPSESLSAKEHTDFLLQSKLLDVPKLLDICSLYGHHNIELTKKLVFNAFKSQPGLTDKLKDIVSLFLNLFETMHQRCVCAVEAFISTDENQESRAGRLHEDFVEVLNFINDAVVTLDAFVEACPLAAAYFITSAKSMNTKELLPALGTIHDSLIPLLYQGFTFTTEALSKSASNCKFPFPSFLEIVRVRLLKFAWQILHVCYLSESFVQNYSYGSSTEVFPAQIQDSRVRAEIIIETIAQIASDLSGSIGGAVDNNSFLLNLDRRHNLISNVRNLCEKGWISLEEPELQYLSQLVGHDVFKVEKTSSETITSISTLAVQDHADDDEHIILQSKISQIKDIFPDYGAGFLSACLDVYNNNAEEVIQRILEGTLHPDLQSLDVSLESKPSKNQSLLGKNNKGKEKLISSDETVVQDKVKPTNAFMNISSSSTSQRDDLSATAETNFKATGRFVRRPKEDAIAMDILDQCPVKESFRSVVLATQYEDEYDDSFDELGVSYPDIQDEEAQSPKDSNLSQTVSLARNFSDGDSWRGNSSKDHGQLIPEMSHPETANSSTTVGNTRSDFSGKGKFKKSQKPQFYVKDGKNYSYKVAGAVPVSNIEEANTIKRMEEETIYGLGAGGNVPLKVGVKDSDESLDDQTNNSDRINHGSMKAKGSFGRGSQFTNRNANSRKNDNHHRKDRAMKKHFGSLSGY